MRRAQDRARGPERSDTLLKKTSIRCNGNSIQKILTVQIYFRKIDFNFNFFTSLFTLTLIKSESEYQKHFTFASHFSDSYN